MSWQDFENQAPALALLCRKRLHDRIAYLATIRRDGSPRLHPVTPFIGDGILVMATEPSSPKIRDLKRDGRYVLHGAVSREGPLVEVALSGMADVVSGPSYRARALAVIGSAVPDDYVLFEFQLWHVLVVQYDDGERCVRRWRAPQRPGVSSVR